jgi:RND family efflux transporter MFP subunit
MNNTLRWLVTLGCIVAAGCGKSDKLIEPDRPVSAAARPAATPAGITVVEVFEVTSAATPGEQIVPAVVSVERTAVILAQRDGVLVELKGDEGTRVAKGAVIARLNDEDPRTQLRQAEIEANRSAIEEKQYEAMVKVTRSELDEEVSLAEQGLSSKRQVNRAEYKLEVAKQELERTRLTTRAAQAKVEAAKLEIDKTLVRAPIDGIITHRIAKLGAGVVKNDKLFEVAQLQRLEVRFQLPQGEQGRPGPGSLVNISPAESDRVIARARVRRIDPTADAASNTLGYLADVIGGAGLMPGMAVNVRLPRGHSVETHWIPRSAFSAVTDVRRGASPTLFVIEDDKCAARVVRVNAVEGEQVEVGPGLRTGDRVILSPPSGLKSDDAVRAKTP